MTLGLTLIIDQGGQSSRATVINAAGQRIAMAQKSIASQHKDGGIVEHNSTELVASLQYCVQQLAAQLSVEQVANIDYSALLVQRSSFIACSKSTGVALSPVISWQDTRGQAWLTGLQLTAAQMADLQTETGLRINAHYGASKMRYLLQHEPAVIQAAQDDDLLFMPLGSFLAAKLCGTRQFVAEPSLAQRTYLYSIRQQAWSQKLCDFFAIKSSYLPKLLSTQSDYGQFFCGSQPLSLHCVAGDQNFIAYSAGLAMLDNSLFINVGTAAFMLAAMPAAKTPAGFLQSVIYADEPLHSLAEATVNNAANSLQYFYRQQAREFDAQQLETILEQEQDPGVCLNTLAGTGTPFWLAAGGLQFMPNKGSFSQQITAVLESIVFALQDNWQLLKDSDGNGISQCIVSGGVAKSSSFCQRLADMTGLKILRSEETEASSFGAWVFLRGGEPKEISFDEFTPQNNPALLERYADYRQLLQQRIDGG